MIHTGTEARAFVGFDGYVDSLFHVVQRRGPGSPTYFDTIGEFARHIANAAGQSADIELVCQERRFGGNAPLMANALAHLGMRSTCVGAMGYPEMHPAFRPLHPHCRTMSVCNPADTQALEFSDGKLMFADLASLDDLDGEHVKARIGWGALSSLLAESTLVALVNWGGLVKAHELWSEVFRELPPPPSASPSAPSPRHVFIDLADFSKRTTEDLVRLVGLLQGFHGRNAITIGLNEHEAGILHGKLVAAGCMRASDTHGDRLEDLCAALHAALGLGAVVVHPLDCSCVATAAGVTRRPGRRVAAPRVSTGGGDNFNAGYCFGRSLGLREPLCLDLAMAVSRLYVLEGQSPSIERVAKELREDA